MIHLYLKHAVRVLQKNRGFALAVIAPLPLPSA